MARTLSNMLALGTPAPAFSLPDVISGNIVTLESLRAPVAVVLMFICNHCPFVKHCQSELVRLAKDYQPKGVKFAAISSNDPVNFPEDNPERMREVALACGYTFPYLFDESQSVAKAYQAACTPDFFVFDRDLKCIYRGQLDDSRPDNGIAVSGKDVRAALDCVLQGLPVSPDQKPSLGCNIKWR